MFRRIKAAYAAWRFKRATAAFDAEIEAVRAKHGRVSEAEAKKTAALHKALAEAVRS